LVSCKPPLILDHKTGSSKDFSSPEEDDQMKTLALIPDQAEAVVAVLHADRRGLPQIYAGELGPVALRQHRQKLKSSLLRINDGSMNPGPWCGHCPGRGVCPTQFAELIPSAVAIVEGAEGVVVRSASSTLTTAAQVGKMHLLRTKMNQLLKKVDEEIHAWVREHPEDVVVRPDGKVLEWVTRESESISKKNFIEVLGKVDAERAFEKLRKQGVLVKNSREELHAVND
jgi:hypothetical protein